VSAARGVTAADRPGAAAGRAHGPVGAAAGAAHPSPGVEAPAARAILAALSPERRHLRVGGPARLWGRGVSGPDERAGTAFGPHPPSTALSAGGSGRCRAARNPPTS